MVGSAGFSLKARVARSVFWLAWSRGVVQLLSFVTTILVARILVPADYGVMAIASVFTGMGGILAEMGLGRAIIQFRDLDRREIDTCFWITMTVAMIAYAVLSLGAPIIARWFGVPRLADVLPVLAVVLPLTACSIVSDSLLRKRLALDRISQAEIIGAAVALPVMLGCALSGLGVWTLVVGALASVVIKDLAIFAFAPWFPGLRIGGERAREMLHFALTTLGITTMWALREQADVLVIGKITGQVSVGLYSMAKDLAMLPTNKISSAVNMLSSPMMAELQTNIEAMRRAFYRAARLTSAIALPASTGLALVADDVVAALLGPRWLPAVALLRLLCIYSAVRALEVMLPPVLFARLRHRFLFWWYLALLVVVPAVTVLGAEWDGAAGAVKFFTPAYCVLISILTKKVLAELKGSFLELWSETWPILTATATMAVLVLLLRKFILGAVPEPPLVELILLSVSGAVTYLGVLLAVGRTIVGEGAEVIGWIILRRRSID